MEPNQLPLDFEPFESTKTVKETAVKNAVVYDFSKAKEKQAELERRRLHQSILSSVDHYFDDLKQK
jgi:hypothetical protein